MHVFWSFFAWPAGSTWSNVLAMPSCGVLATVFAVVFRDKIGRAIRDWHRRHLGHHDELGRIHARLDDHADLLDVGTAGGLADVMAEVRRAREDFADVLSMLNALHGPGGEKEKP